MVYEKEEGVVDNVDNVDNINSVKSSILAITNFENVNSGSANSHDSNSRLSNLIKKNDDGEDNVEGSNEEDANNYDNANKAVPNKEDDSEDDSEEVISDSDITTMRQKESEKTLLAGGADYVYTIDYILADDEKLIDNEKVLKAVNKYIDNYNSQYMINYKKQFSQIYQKYSNKNYIITTTLEHKKKNSLSNSLSNLPKTKIIVKKNDSSSKIVKELIKPSYIYYNENGKLLIIKRNISNARTELLYKYEQLIAKLNITPEDKKAFEKEKKDFIELLEQYYIYTLYHKKINKIITSNKSNLIIQKEFEFYKENDEHIYNTLNSNLYLVDNSIIDSMNKINSDKLTQFNTIMNSLSGKQYKDIIKDKKLKETIKTYIDKKELLDIYSNLNKISNVQDEYIDYIIDF